MNFVKLLVTLTFSILSQSALGVEIVEEIKTPVAANAGYIVILENGNVTVQTRSQENLEALDKYSPDEVPGEKLKNVVVILCDEVRFSGTGTTPGIQTSSLECKGKVRFQAHGVFGRADQLLCTQEGKRFRCLAKGKSEVMLFRARPNESLDPTVTLKASTLEFDSTGAKMSIRGTGNLETYIDQKR